HLGLLEHDLADPDAIRIAVAAPGQLALLPSEPGKQAARKPGTQFGGEGRRGGKGARSHNDLCSKNKRGRVRQPVGAAAPRHGLTRAKSVRGSGPAKAPESRTLR